MPPRRTTLFAAATLLPLAACSTPRPAAPSREQAIAGLRAAETAFADTMARRDHAGFGRHLHEHAVFINGGRPLRGREAIMADWQRHYTGPQAPFAWRPELVELGGDGTLGYTEGPVTNPAGATIARFYSTWLRDGDGRWFVVFDNGYAVCR